MKTLDDLNLKGEKVLLRLDLNSTVEDGEIEVTPRMEAHSSSVEEIVDRGAAVVILAHQGRPGREDFLHLNQHAEILQKMIDREVRFIEDVAGKRAIEAIENLESGNVLLLDNVRMDPDELKDRKPSEHARSDLVKKLSAVCDVYVNDAFSVCHRNQESITGFPQIMKSAAGPRLEKELESLNKLGDPKRPVHFVLGGNKPEDAVEVLENMFEAGNLDRVYLGGIVAKVFLQVKGIDLGEESFDLGGLEGKIENVLNQYEDKILLPEDLAYSENGKRAETSVEDLPIDEITFDVGKKTVNKFKDGMRSAETLIFNGPVGKFEDERFSEGTEEILDAMAGLEKFTMLGGGETSKAADQMGFDLNRDFSHVSLAGGAFISYLSGEKLPGVEALK